MHRIRRHLTYANVAATLAIVIAVAGGTTAIATKSTAPKNSVTSKSIRPYNVTSRDLTRMIQVFGKASFNDPEPPDGNFSSNIATATCPPGTRVLTGGGSVDNDRAHLSGSQPNPGSWSIVARGDGTNEARITAIAWCLSKKAENPGRGEG
jgi:hypothetical protein